MAIVLVALSVAFSAFCIWVLIQIINRRENSDNEFLAIVCIAVLLLLVIIAPSIGLYLLYRLAILPNSGAAPKMAPPPPVQPSGR